MAWITSVSLKASAGRKSHSMTDMRSQTRTLWTSPSQTQYVNRCTISRKTVGEAANPHHIYAPTPRRCMCRRMQL